MRKTTSVLLALCALAAAAGRANKADPEPLAGAKAELKKLQGTWTVTKAIPGKRKPPFEVTYTFDGDKLRRVAYPPGPKDRGGKGMQRLPTYKVKIDTKMKPHGIELTRAGRKSGGVVLAGVYKIEKGELLLALGEGKNAPKDFKGVGEGVLVYVLKREKSKEKAKKQAKE
jgi:uncharacterized protein (TIGR03067 family)